MQPAELLQWIFEHPFEGAVWINGAVVFAAAIAFVVSVSFHSCVPRWHRAYFQFWIMVMTIRAWVVNVDREPSFTDWNSNLFWLGALTGFIVLIVGLVKGMIDHDRKTRVIVHE